MSVTCPDGHTSTATDFCDVCGAPIGGAAGTAAAGAPDAASPATGPVPSVGPPASTTICPGCGNPVSTDALFCESCGRDMVTGQMPAAPVAGAGTEGGTPPPRASTGWVAEVWVDEEWFAARGEGRCPTVGEPKTFPVADGALIGRHSKSRGIDPDVDCTSDGSVSGRQATLGFDGTRWTITDLGSTNGTFVAHAGAPLPTEPIAPNQVLELETADRILVGAHTRIVIRAETAAESATPTPTA